MLDVIEIDSDDQIAAIIVFDLDDFDAAIAELDARYLAGEAAAHAHTWSVDRGNLRRGQPARTPGDDTGLGEHRPPSGDSASRPVELIRIHPRRMGRLSKTSGTYVEAVHRLSNLGAVSAMRRMVISHEGFDAEWRGVNVVTVDGDMVNRTEVFDEADLDAAIARFDQLSRPTPRLENTASQVADRVMAYFTARDWDAATDDAGRRLFERRSPPGRERRAATWSGCRDQGRVRRPPTSALTNVTSTVIATRGDRLVLTSFAILGRGPATPGRFTSMHSASSRSTPTSGSRRTSPSTSTTSTPPSRSSTRATSPAKQPPTRAHGRSSPSGLRRAQPARTSPDDARLGEHRPPAGDVNRARRHDRVTPTPHGTSRLTLSIYIEAVHRLGQPRSGRHPRGA